MSIIGVDLGGTRIKTGIIQDGRVTDLTMTEIAFNNGLSTHLPLLKLLISELADKLAHRNIKGVGVAFPGLVDSVRNVVIDTSEKYDDAPILDLAKWSEAEFGLPLRIENDARLACMAEWKYGAGKGNTDIVMCTLGTGVGSAAIIDNKVLRGKHFQAGILGGHSIIDFENVSNQCSCGNYGCVEALASTWMIQAFVDKHPLFNDSQLSKLTKVDLAMVFELSAAGDALSILVRDRCMQAWAIGIVNLIHAYDPDLVVVGGGVMHSKNIILPYFKEVIAERTWCPSGTPEIRAGDYPDTAALLGTSLLFE